jgi:hypothetical protein
VGRRRALLTPHSPGCRLRCPRGVGGQALAFCCCCCCWR